MFFRLLILLLIFPIVTGCTKNNQRTDGIIGFDQYGLVELDVQTGQYRRYSNIPLDLGGFLPGCLRWVEERQVLIMTDVKSEKLWKIDWDKRDQEPSNIFVSPSNCVISDFSIASNSTHIYFILRNRDSLVSKLVEFDYESTECSILYEIDASDSLEKVVCLDDAPVRIDEDHFLLWVALNQSGKRVHGILKLALSTGELEILMTETHIFHPIYCPSLRQVFYQTDNNLFFYNLDTNQRINIKRDSLPGRLYQRCFIENDQIAFQVKDPTYGYKVLGIYIFDLRSGNFHRITREFPYSMTYVRNRPIKS